jgi:hypothetical protein
MHPSKMPQEIFRRLGGEAVQEATLNNRSWRIAPGRTRSGFIGISEDANRTAIAIWLDFPEEGDQPAMEIIVSTANPPDWAPVDSKMDTGFAKAKYGALWLAYAVLINAHDVAAIGRGV